MEAHACLLCSLIFRCCQPQQSTMSAVRPGAALLLLSVGAARAQDPDTLELALEYAWKIAKVLFAFSPVLAVFAVLAFAKEDEETEAEKRRLSKCCKKS